MTMTNIHESFHILRKDIFNYRDICCFFFFNNGDTFFIINIYSDNYQSALKYLKNTKANIWNILIIASNFNIRDNDWDSLYSFHLTYSDTLLKIADSFNLSLSSLVQQVLTQYSNNILSELWYPSNYALLTIDISITEELIQNKCQTIIRNSKEEENFIADFIKAIRNINTTTILDKDALENTVQEYTGISEMI